MLYASVGGGKEIKMVGVFVKFEILFVLKKIVEEIYPHTEWLCDTRIRCSVTISACASDVI